MATPNRMLLEVFISFLNYRVYSRWFRAELTELYFATIKLRLKIYDYKISVLLVKNKVVYILTI